jgi:hypothetical protein
MFKNRFLLILGALSLLLLALAVVEPLSKPARLEAASDFYQRHPDWIWETSNENILIPLTGDAAFPDYYERHPGLSAAAEISVDTTDYVFRHQELFSPARLIDLTDYYFRHP